MKDLFDAAVHYQRSRGIHGAALADRERLLVVAEDVGRHNAVDKVKGEALLRGIPTEDRLLLSTGRISSEMLLKAARMGVPVVASRTSPTEMARGAGRAARRHGVRLRAPDALNVYAGDGRRCSTPTPWAAPVTDGPSAPGEDSAGRRAPTAAASGRRTSATTTRSISFGEARAKLVDDPDRVDRRIFEALPPLQPARRTARSSICRRGGRIMELSGRPGGRRRRRPCSKSATGCTHR